MPPVPHLPLNDGTTLPQIGYGVFMISPDDVVAPLSAAIETGYRLIDTAAAYGNEEGVGKAIANSGVPRAEFVVTTKLWNDDHGHDETLRAFDRSADKLGLDTVDLYLIHYPRPALGKYVESWRAMVRLREEGRIRSIGVSNFGVPELDRLAEETGVVPAVNQVELHPMFPQDDLRAAHAERGIVTQAWSPIGRNQGLLQHPDVVAIARAVDRTPAQVVLRWHLQLGVVVIPKSERDDRIRANFDLTGFALDEAQMAALGALGEQRCNPVPGTLFDVS
ncbi:aldo/keto reductase [Actinokineospora sp. PR83]|uniref:aldo/keto reductase n=1 Tax=Actinokineospora sp. PR83 TaxID=2884908 RepID=UPI0027E00954|nr:aldo/keto reductase [Actinokineospora sp. PR83]MCG8917252.1 aldo/keto reductase [Actinokineospora sp. PR83]